MPPGQNFLIYNMKRYKSWIIGAIGLLLAVEIGIYTGVVFPHVAQSRNRVAAAQRIQKRCADAPSKAGCYDREIPKLLASVSMEEAFIITSQIQKQDPSYAYCHVLGHELSAQETRKNPSAWMDVVTRCPSGTCSNGCIHGAFQERFRSEVLTAAETEAQFSDFQAVCMPRERWQPTGLEQANCFHALGHLLMYITGADTPRAVEYCARLTSESETQAFRRVCFDGVFMQLFQPLEPEDKELIRGKEVRRDTHAAFCRAWTGDDPWLSCWTEGWPLYLTELYHPEGFVSFCSQVPQDQQSQCAMALTYIMTVQMRFELPSIASYCGSLSDPWQRRCYAGVASRLIENDKHSAFQAAGWCGQAPQDVQSDCFDEVVFSSSYMLVAGSPEHTALCAALPGDWKAECQKQNE